MRFTHIQFYKTVYLIPLAVGEQELDPTTELPTFEQANDYIEKNQHRFTGFENVYFLCIDKTLGDNVRFKQFR